MKSKKGYREQKNKCSTGKWLKRYFEKRTCRKWRYAGLDFVGTEIDKDYFDAACKRFKEETRQLKLF